MPSRVGRLRLSAEIRHRRIGEYQTIMERLTDMDIGIDKYFSFVVLKSPIVKAHLPLTSLFPV